VAEATNCAGELTVAPLAGDEMVTLPVVAAAATVILMLL